MLVAEGERKPVPGVADVIEPANLVRIEATHRGFTYQGLYAVACFLAMDSSMTTSVSVELDEDIELERATSRIYIQVKTRKRSLRLSDIQQEISRFAAVRAEHVAGKRSRTARFAVVSNSPPGADLLRQIQGDDWPGDIALVWPGDSVGAVDLDLPAPQSDLPKAVQQCVALAETIPFSNLAPITVVLKLFGFAQYLSTGQQGHSVSDVEVRSLLEQLVFQVQDLPTPPAIYLTQGTEPPFNSADHVNLVVGVSGAGKTSWAAYRALRHPHPVVYFDVGDLPGSAVASSLARELAAKFFSTSETGIVPRIPAGSGLEILKYCSRRIQDQGQHLTLILDNIHRISSASARSVVEALPDLSFVLLAQPWPGEGELEAMLQIQATHLDGWSIDQVSAVFAEAGSRVSVSEATRILRLTGGIPLYVNAAARLAASEYSGQAARLVDDLEHRRTPLQTVQEVLLSAVFNELSENARKVASLLEMVEIPLDVDDLCELSEAWALSGGEVGRTVRHLVRAGIAVRLGPTSIKLHDAFRLLARDHQIDLGPAAVPAAREAILAMLLRHGPAGSSIDRIRLLVRMLALTNRHETLVELATSEEFHQFGAPDEVRAILERVSTHGESTNDRFWALDALAFWDYRERSLSSFVRRVEEMEQIDDPDASNREAAALAMKQMLATSVTGQRGDLDLHRSSALAIIDGRSAVGRLVRYNYALALHMMGADSDVEETLVPLVKEYLQSLSLTSGDLHFVNAGDLRSRLHGVPDVEDHLRHLADCLYLQATVNSKIGDQAGLRFIHAMKLYVASGAWDSAVKSGQDAADQMAGLGDITGARMILENHVLPVVTSYGLMGLLVPTRAQHAVLLAWDGEIAEAREELRRLSVFEVSEEQRAELSNQRALVEEIARAHGELDAGGARHQPTPPP